MITSVFLLILSLVALYIGADWLVKGSSNMAFRAKISPLVVGLTVVAFGTSAPELVVSINASVTGQGDIALGNIIGSNIFNICAILGISAMIYPLQAKQQLTKTDIPVMLVASALFTVFCWQGSIGRLTGILFVLGIATYTTLSILYSRRNKTETELSPDKPSSIPTRHWSFDLLYMSAGLVILVFASRLLIDNAVDIAQSFGVSQAVIGLTIVAAGTSMPELATSVVAAIKKSPEIAVGNIVGSNIFNILGIAGITSCVKPLHTEYINQVDLAVMLFASILLLPLVKSGQKISRIEGIVLFLIYVLYILWLLKDLI